MCKYSKIANFNHVQHGMEAYLKGNCYFYWFILQFGHLPIFVVDIPTKEDYKEVEPINYNINCYTDGSKLDDNRTGAGVLINYSQIDSAEEAIHLGNSATVFQAEVFAVGRTASHLIFAETNNKSVVINCDSQAAIMAIDNTKIKSKTTLDAVLALNKLGENNQVLIRWIPGYQHTAAIWEMKKLTLLLKEEPTTQMRPYSSCRFPRLLGTWQ